MSKKKYYEFTDELTQKEVMEGLFIYGFIPEKVPPFLTTEKFYEFCQKQKSDFFKIDPTGYINYESMRNINIPRNMGIPHPIAYYNQCYILSWYWKKIKSISRKNTSTHTHKISRIHLRKLKNTKAIFEMNYKNFNDDDFPEPDLLIGQNYIVKADISNCFPSIYTHALSWALVGKERAKKKTKDQKSWFNRIDFYTRNLKEGETHGVLIGCKSSNLIAELLLTNIDNILYNKGWRYTRAIDDYTCYVTTNRQAEKFLIDLDTELKKLGLSLNHKKTIIEKLPQPSSASWVRQLNDYIFPDSLLKLNTLKNFIDLSLTLMKSNNDNTAILNYAIKIIAGKKLTDNAKDYFVKTFWHLVLIYPYLIQMVDEYLFKSFSISTDDIETISKSIYKRAKANSQYEAMSYVTFFSLEYEFHMDDLLYDDAINSNDCIFMLLSYLHDKRQKGYNKKGYKKLAKELYDSDNDKYWLFTYEVLTQDLLNEKWKVIKKGKVSFINPRYS